LGNEGDASAAEASLKAHGLAYEWCRLDHGDYLQIDGHPTAAGYDKLMACADRALNTKWAGRTYATSRRGRSTGEFASREEGEAASRSHQRR
jgi:hypothetical protein